MNHLRILEPDVLYFEYDNSYRWINNNNLSINSPIHEFYNNEESSLEPVAKENEYLYYIVIKYSDLEIHHEILRVSYSTLFSIKKEFPTKFIYKYKRCWLWKCLFGENGDV